MANVHGPLEHVPAWMQELSTIIQLQLDLVASMASMNPSSEIGGQPAPCDFESLRVRFAKHKANAGLGSEGDSSSPKGFGLLGREDRPRFQQPQVIPMVSITEDGEMDEVDKILGKCGRSEEGEETYDCDEQERNQDQTQMFKTDVTESYDRRMMESVIIEKEEMFPNGLLNPRWIGKLCWDFGVMFFVLMDAIVLPFQLTFKSNTNNDEMDSFDLIWLWVTTLVFAVDIILSFNTAVERESQVASRHGLILHRWKIAQTYLRGWFVIDFGSTVPWAQISSTLTSGDSSQLTRLTKVVKFLRLLRLVRMLRLAKLKTMWERMEIRIGSVYIIQCISLLRVLCVVVAMCHWSACLFWLIGLPRNLFTEALMGEQEQLAYEAEPHWTTVWRYHDSQSTAWRWLDRSVSETYVFCFYWTLGVMRTMPAEVTPVNLPERIFVLIFMFFALSAFAISIALITQSFFKLSERKKTFNEDYVALRLHLQKTKVSEDVQGRVKSYLTHLFERRRIQAKEANLLNMLPENLREEVFRCQAAHHMAQLPIMHSFRLAAAAATCDLMPGQAVVQKGELIDAAWILMTGQLHRDDADADAEEFPQVLHAECLEDTEGPRYARGRVVATEMSEVLKVDKASFRKIASGFRGSKEHSDPVPSQRPQLKRSMSAVSEDNRVLRDGSDEVNMRATVAVMSTS